MLQLYSYGVMLALGLISSLYYFWKMGKDEHLEEISLFDAYFLATAGYFLVGRGIYAYFVAKLTLLQGIAILAFPGMEMIAGILGAIGMMSMVIWAKNWDYWKIMDISAVALTIVTIFGSLGNLIKSISIVEIFTLISTVIMFALTYQVRKNFRFYAWYKNTRGTAAEGLAAWIYVLLCGIYLAVRSLLFAGEKLPMLVGGISLIILGIMVIYVKSGRKVGLPSVKLINRRSI